MPTVSRTRMAAAPGQLTGLPFTACTTSPARAALGERVVAHLGDDHADDALHQRAGLDVATSAPS